MVGVGDCCSVSVWGVCVCGGRRECVYERALGARWE